MTPRRALSRSQLIQLCARQSDAPILCGCGCGEPLDPEKEGVVDEHVLPRLLGAIGTEGERDVLSNRALYRRPCAKAKTVGDVQRIAKAKRQAGETGQQARRAAGKTKAIRGAGFMSKERRKELQERVEKRIAANRERAE